MNLVIMGYPGAGKGTQAKAISKNFDILHISTGDILRSEIKKESKLGKKAVKFVESGKLVPDEIIVEMIKKILGNNRTKDGFILDGFPRNLKQAEMLSSVIRKLGIKVDKVINIVVNKDEALKRLSKRRTCNVCKNIFSIDGNGHEDRCPKCGGTLVKRKDDDREVIKHRLEVYEEEAGPLTDFYASKGLLVNIDGSGTEKETTERILESL
jgi:adenylate kinase